MPEPAPSTYYFTTPILHFCAPPAAVSEGGAARRPLRGPEGINAPRAHAMPRARARRDARRGRPDGAERDARGGARLTPRQSPGAECPDNAPRREGGPSPRRGHRRGGGHWNPPGRVAGSLGSAGGGRRRGPREDGDRPASRFEEIGSRLRGSGPDGSDSDAPESGGVRRSPSSVRRAREPFDWGCAPRRLTLDGAESTPQLREERCRAPFGPNGSARIVRVIPRQERACSEQASLLRTAARAWRL